MADFRDLYELADRELSVGLADERLVKRALTEANGVDGLARQIYCERRAKEWISPDAGNAAEKIRVEVEEQESRLRARKEFRRWFWALASITSLIATFVFSRFAISAMRTDRNFYPLAALALTLFLFAIVALVASRYHTDTE